MKKKIIDCIFVGCVLLALLAGLCRTALFPAEMNRYENRWANRLARPTAASWLSGSFQDGAEAALSDQIPLAQRIKRAYNLAFSAYTRLALTPLRPAYAARDFRLGDLGIIGDDYLVYYAYQTRSCQAQLDGKIENLNACFASAPETDFYLYFIEKDTDVDFSTSATLKAWEYFEKRIDLPAERKGCFCIENFADYSGRFYRTDHHWNHRGSYQGYCEVLSMLLPDAAPLAPAEELTLGRFSGSKAAGPLREAFSEPFSAYRFDFPAMSVTVNGQSAADYGDQEAFFSGARTDISYSEFYGGDWGETVFDTGNAEKENILILGESFDNAILKLLASHFGRTYSVDLRYYETCMGVPFRLDDYVRSRGITKVLLIGNVDFYMKDEFLLEN